MADIIDSPIRSGDLAAKFAAYFVVGGLTAIMEISLFTIFLYGAGLHYLVAGTLSFVLATAFNYWLTIRFVFQTSSRSRHHEIVLVYIVSAVGIVINLGVLALGIELFHTHPLIGKVAGTAAAFAWNFGARYFWVFRAVDR